MRYLSVCSGIEAATVAWHPLGWTPAAFSEIEAFPRAVLAHHYPEVPLHGDFTTIKGHEYGPVDLLVGGTPCQSFSVAGLRKGLDDPRGNLMLAYGALAKRLGAKWLVWENVPGVLSSNEGRDFGAFLGMLVELGYGFAYRVLDAQHFGVPQRRRRVFVVACLGDWRAAAAVLFERHSMQGHTAPSRQAGESIAHPIAPCLTSSGRGVERGGDTRGQDPVVAVLSVAFSCKDYGADAANDIAPTMRAMGHVGSHANAGGQLAVTYMADDYKNGTFQVCDTARPLTTSADRTRAAPVCVTGDITHTLKAEGFDASEDGTGRGQPIIASMAFAQNSRDEIRLVGGDGEISGALAAEPGMKQTTYVAPGGMRVRRLTPRECERLQGFPDDYTLIPMGKRRKKAEQKELSDYAKNTGQDDIKWSADGPRYKALGNSMAVPCMAWIGSRIQAVAAIQSAPAPMKQEQASMFAEAP